MRNSFLSPRSVVRFARRGFSLTELVVVLTVLGLLAAVSVAGFRALVSESEDQAAVASAASVEREMRALMAFDQGTDENRSEASLSRAFDLVQDDLDAGVSLSTIGGSRPGHLSCGETVVVLRGEETAGQFKPDCVTVTPGDNNDEVNYHQTWMAEGSGGSFGGAVGAGDDALVVQPSVVRNVTLVASGFEEFSFSFDGPADDGGSAVTGFEWRAAVDGGAFSDWESAAGLSDVVSVPGGVADATFEVRAVNAAGVSDPVVVSTQIPQFFPNAVPQVSIIPTGPGMFDASWDEATVPNGGPAASYEWRISLDGGAWSDWEAHSSLTATLTTGVAYNTVDFEVRGVNAAGVSAGTAVSETIPPFAPAAPAALVVDAVGLGVLVDYALTPGPAVGEPTTDWEWRYAVNSGAWSTWDSVGSDATTGQVTIPGLVFEDQFEIEMRGVNIYGSGQATLAAGIVPDFTPDSVEFIVVAGGGGSGGHSGTHGGAGGGGAGGYISSVDGERSGRNTDPVADLIPVAGTSYDVVVGAGGGSRAAGAPSRLGAIEAPGGGRGGDSTCSAPPKAGNGASGGGGGGSVTGYGCSSGSGGAGGTGMAALGTNGGRGGGPCGKCGNPGAGGGGAMGGGHNGNIYASKSGHGGAGATSSITGSAVVYARGGHGEGGGYGGSHGAANTGNGGSAAYRSGGSGVVIIRFAGTKALPTISSGLTYTVSSVDGDHVIRFTSGSGTITW